MSDQQASSLELQVKEQLAWAASYRDKRIWISAASVLVAAVTGGVLVNVTGTVGMIIGASIVLVCVMAALAVFLKRVKPAQCPKCGYLWLFRANRRFVYVDTPDYPTAELTEWKKCPGCGLAMH